jgi:1,2-phenylacetyl-CoA epoxidase catalytic subunit
VRHSSPQGLANLHDLEPEDFAEEVHSFEHWFGSVRDYLSDLDHGHRRDLDEAAITPLQRDRLVAVLCSYAVAETAALEASSGLVRLAPNHASKIFLSTQTVDEGRHVEVVVHRLRELGVADPGAEVERRASRSIRSLRERILSLVNAQDWDSAIFAQNVALETMEYTMFRAHARVADPVTRDLLERILRDERRHIGFGENELGRRLAESRARRLGLVALKAELDALVVATFEETLDELRFPRSERPDLGRDYLHAVARLGLDG